MHCCRLFVRVACIMMIACGSFAISNTATAQDISVSEGSLKMTAPEGWKKQQPRVNLIEAEYEVPLEDGDEGSVRVTWMQVGGGVKANVDRWQGQFYGAEPTKKEMQVDGQTVYMVELNGSFKDTGGRPFGDPTERKNYAMVAAIIEMKEGAEYYIKMVGPAKTVKANAEAFSKMVEGMKFE